MGKLKDKMLNHLKGHFEQRLKNIFRYRQMINKIGIFANHNINRRSEFIHMTYHNSICI